MINGATPQRPVTTSNVELDSLCINTIRFLAVDAVQKAKSGHPGMPLGAAPMAYTLWDRLLSFDPRAARWPDRDRFVLSAGHASMLLYALLHLTGYAVSLDEIKQFRQWESPLAGHPEYGAAPGIEATTGPLGQGLANAVGMAIAEEALAARFNRPGHTIVDHYTYVLASDGDLMEGVSAEACSLAGHLRLAKLIVLYDDNRISIEGSTDLAFSEDRAARFAAYGWHVQHVEDGNDVAAIETALHTARAEGERPSFIRVRTHIGYGSPHKQDSASAHGEPLGEEEVRLTKQALGWPTEPAFLIPTEARAHLEQAATRGHRRQQAWQERLAAYAGAYPDLAREFERVMEGKLPDGWEKDIPVFTPAGGALATRNASGKVLNALAHRLPELMGGAADLAPSTRTLLDGGGDFAAGNRAGRNLHFGVREHGMGAILNGMALHGGLLPYGATFFIFSDYMRPPMRLAALSALHVIYVFTHDSIGVGEDGPTHQPVEQLLGLRSIPGFIVIRPADANETAAAWRVAIETPDQPVALILSRQNLPVIDADQHPGMYEGVKAGAYVLADPPDGLPAELLLVATGSEVPLALAAYDRLTAEGEHVRVVSMPSWNLFECQPGAYRDFVFPPGVRVLAIEAGVSLGWRSYVHGQVGAVAVDRFGASAPGAVVMHEYGFNVDNVCRQARSVLDSREE